MKKIISFITAFVICFSLTTNLFAYNVPDIHPDKLFEQASDLYNNGHKEEALAYYLAAHTKNPTAAIKRKIADLYVELEEYDLAIPFYHEAADIYDSIGDPDAAIVLNQKANTITTNVNMYIEKSTTISSSSSLAKYEPEYGMYMGGYFEMDPNIGQKKMALFNTLVEKNQSVFYIYHKYGNVFNQMWVDKVKEAGAIAHISLEPSNGLGEVNSDEYLINYAKACGESQIPIFLRFASEMNGDWVPWNGDTELYIEKFRLVHDIMERYAPNVVMVWAPNSVPQKKIDIYYPGDNYVDWVGVNLYSVTVFNGDKNQPADHVNPLDLLDYVYNQYSNKPIAITEYAATHYSAAENKDTSEFAKTKMRLMYYGLMLKYPRVKMINWYSVNNLTSAHNTERQLNNFTLTENQEVFNTYKSIISNDYFFTKPVNGPYVDDESLTNRKVLEPFVNEMIIKDNNLSLKGYIKTYDPYISNVVYSIDENIVSESNEFPYLLNIDLSTYTIGKHTLSIRVYDSENKLASNKNYTFYYIEKPEPELPKNKVQLQIGNLNSTVNQSGFKLSSPPFINEQSQTMVPLRFIAENFGMNVTYVGSEKKIILKKQDKTITLWIGNNQASVDEALISLESKPTIVSKTTFVPLRFVIEALDLKINYISSTKEIIIE